MSQSLLPSEVFRTSSTPWNAGPKGRPLPAPTHGSFRMRSSAAFSTLAVTLGLSAITCSAMAAPYCLQIFGVSPQCIYGDVRACSREAARQHGNCTFNPGEIKAPASAAARFCMVFDGPGFDCSYVDRRTCDAQAPARGGICVDRTPGQPDVNIFHR